MYRANFRQFQQQSAVPSVDHYRRKCNALQSVAVLADPEFYNGGGRIEIEFLPEKGGFWYILI